MSNTAPAKQVRKPKKLPFVIMCILSAIVAVLNVLLCVLVPKYYTTINSFLYKGPDADKVAAFRQASADMTQKVESEGIVMLENKNQTLPLASGSKINLFGYGSRDTVYGGSGSGSGDSSNNITLEQGLTNAGFSVNPELVSFYNDHFVERTGVGFTGNNFDINEPAVNEYSDEMIANAKAYSDVAVFVVSRLGGEGADLPMDMDPNATTHIVSSGKDIEQVVKGADAGKHYLELQSVEQQVLDMLKENFGTVVVLVNSTNAMELGFLEDEGVDAALWIGCLGSTGANAVGEVLSGAVNPSGRTTDTFAYAVESAPSYYSIGAYNYTNCEWVNTSPIGGGAAPDFYHYVDYIEGIYVGYRYYETAAEDGFIDYDATVQYPFGYGLSYTDFEESIQKADASTIGDLAKAVQQLFGDTGTNIIGTRHGEKLFETLMTREERLRSQDMGHYFRVSADNRDLNYDKFVVKGEVHTMADESYTSHNTTRLDVEGTVKKILTTEYVQNELKGIPNV